MFENLSKEVIEKVKQAKSREEALEILKQNGITLSDEDLANAAGGEGCETDMPCFFDGIPLPPCTTDTLVCPPDTTGCPIVGPCASFFICPGDNIPREPGAFCNTHCWFYRDP